MRPWPWRKSGKNRSSSWPGPWLWPSNQWKKHEETVRLSQNGCCGCAHLMHRLRLDIRPHLAGTRDFVDSGRSLAPHLCRMSDSLAAQWVNGSRLESSNLILLVFFQAILAWTPKWIFPKPSKPKRNHYRFAATAEGSTWDDTWLSCKKCDVHSTWDESMWGMSTWKWRDQYPPAGNWEPYRITQTNSCARYLI